MNRPITTLFMLESLDGKISSGSTDNLDVDKDYPKIDGGKDVSTLVDGESIRDESELYKLMPLQLQECNRLENSYIQLKYKVL